MLKVGAGTTRRLIVPTRSDRFALLRPVEPHLMMGGEISESQREPQASSKHIFNTTSRHAETPRPSLALASWGSRRPKLILTTAPAFHSLPQDHTQLHMRLHSFPCVGYSCTMVFTRAEHLSRHVRSASPSAQTPLQSTHARPTESTLATSPLSAIAAASSQGSTTCVPSSVAAFWLLELMTRQREQVRQHASTIHPEKRSENEETLKRLKGVHDSLLQTKRKASDGASQERPKRRRTRAASPKLEQSIEQECKNTMQDLDSPEAPRWAPPHPKPRLHSLTATSSEPTPYPRHLPPSPPIFQIPQDPLPQPPDYENPLIRADIASFLDGHRDGKAHSGEPMSFDEVADFLRGHWDRLVSTLLIFRRVSGLRRASSRRAAKARRRRETWTEKRARGRACWTRR